jgi:osmoprotectant transport system permease protein
MWNQFVEQLELLPGYLSAHLTLTLIAMAGGMLICLPLALLVLRFERLQAPVLAVASLIQTIPSLALLALMVPLLGQIGFLPAIIALTAYSVLPILRNTITGISGVDAAIIEAARGVGMRNWQILWRVQLPLASPVIMAGIRTAVVWVVGIATLSTPVGATSLGNYIFSGLQTQNHVAVLMGCMAAGLLAMLLDGLIRLIELAIVNQSRRLGTLAGIGLLCLWMVGSAPLIVTRWSADARPRVTIGGKAFTEQYLLTQLLADRFRAAGFAPQIRESLGSMVIFDALRFGEIDCYVDYSGTIWFNAMKRQEVASAPVVLAQVTEWLADTHEITVLGSLGFENAYVFAMRRDRAAELGVRTISDLARAAPSLTLGADFEFLDRPDWHSVRETYGLQFGERLQLDPTLMYQAVDEGRVDVITAFSTDARIEAYDLVLLEDLRHAFPPYAAMILLSARAAEDPEVQAALEPLLGSIAEQTMRGANRMVDVERQSRSEAVAWLLDQAEMAPTD